MTKNEKNTFAGKIERKTKKREKKIWNYFNGGNRTGEKRKIGQVWMGSETNSLRWDAMSMFMLRASAFLAEMLFFINFPFPNIVCHTQHRIHKHTFPTHEANQNFAHLILFACHDEFSNSSASASCEAWEEKCERKTCYKFILSWINYLLLWLLLWISDIEVLSFEHQHRENRGRARETNNKTSCYKVLYSSLWNGWAAEKKKCCLNIVRLPKKKIIQLGIVTVLSHGDSEKCVGVKIRQR